MPSTYSPSLKIELIASGEASGTWGVLTNNNLGSVIEQAIAYTTSVNVTSGNVTLTSLNGVVDQARSAVLEVTGTPGVTRVITVPNVQKTYTVRNRTANIAQIKTASGTAFDCPALSDSYLVCNGSNVVAGRSITDGANTITSLAAPFASPAFTGVPTAPTASPGTNTTQLATTAFVQVIAATQITLQQVYPVGSVYINASNITSPATLLGFGTWSAIGAGRVVLTKMRLKPILPHRLRHCKTQFKNLACLGADTVLCYKSIVFIRKVIKWKKSATNRYMTALWLSNPR